jgi:hypothetical protein
VPAVPEESFIAADRPGTILGVREDGAFRTNLVLVSADATRAIDAEVTLVSREGVTLASQRVALPPLGLVQLGRVVRALGVTGDVTGARLVVTAPRGKPWRPRPSSTPSPTIPVR